MSFKTYLCWATDKPHEFLGNANSERVPNHLAFQVCRDHLPQINRCRRDKGLEELIEFADSYPSRERFQLVEGGEDDWAT